MGFFRNELMSKELGSYLDAIKETEEWYPLQKKLVHNISEEYNIGKYAFSVAGPGSVSHPQGQYREEIVYDDGSTGEDSETIVMHFEKEDGGYCRHRIVVKLGKNWSFEQKDDLRHMAELVHIYSSRQAVAKMLKHNLTTDMMTGIKNSSGFFEHVEKVCQRENKEDYYLLFFNVCNFKYVNKIFNFREGDVILKKYAEEVQRAVKGNDTVARMGGDNFVAFIHKEHLEDFLYHINHLAVSHEALGISKNLVFEARTGVAPMDNSITNRALMGRCSMAYHVARRSKNKTVFYSRELSTTIEKQQDAFLHFSEALKEHEFVVYYQPKVCLENMEICGAEALVRWFRMGELIPPVQFIPVLEEDGGICKLDYYVLEEVCKQLSKWKKEGRELVTVSVNFSRKHLDDDEFINNVMNIINKYQIDTRWIEVELTESNDYQDYQIMTEVVRKFKEKGIICSIDDFGTGYSSLNMLKSTPFDVVKIDRSFIPNTDGKEGTEKERALFKGIMEILKEMGMESIAEGVEQKEQIDYLKDAKCYMVQGYIFDKPLPVEEFETRLDNRKYSL